MPHVDVSLAIATHPDAVWRVVTDIERYPSYMATVLGVTIVEETTEHRVSDWSVLLKGSILEWREAEDLDNAKRRIDFHQLDGDLAYFTGSWSVEPNEDRTSVLSLNVEFDIGLPLLADMLNPVAARALRENAALMLAEVEKLSTAVEGEPSHDRSK